MILELYSDDEDDSEGLFGPNTINGASDEIQASDVNDGYRGTVAMATGQQNDGEDNSSAAVTDATSVRSAGVISATSTRS